MAVKAYFRLFDILKEQILSGYYLPGQRIPTERELCGQFGVSRITARHALRLLSEQGMLDRQVGRGSYVRSARPAKLPILQNDFTGSVRREAPSMKRRLLSKQFGIAPPHIAETLGLLKVEKCLIAQRLDLLEDEPLAYDTVHIPLNLAGNISDEMLIRIDFLESWLAAEGIALSHSVESIEAKLADVEAAKRLGVNQSSPVLAVMDTIYITDSRAAGVFESVYRADRFRLISTIKREQSHAHTD